MKAFWKVCLSALLLGFVVIPAQAADAPTTTNDAAESAFILAHEQWRSAAVATLASSKDADSLYAAAYLAGASLDNAHTEDKDDLRKSQQTSLDYLDQAAALAPNAADIAARALMLCDQISACDLAVYADRYRTAAPDDARVWLPALQRAQKQHDETNVTAILQSMGAAQSFGSYQVAAAQRLQRGLAHVSPSPSFDDAVTSMDYDESFREQMATVLSSVQASAMAASITMPAFGSLNKACKPTLAVFAQRRSACRSVGLLLEQNGSYLNRRIGLLLHRRAADSDTDRAAAIASGRRLDWQSKQYYSKLASNVTAMAGASQPTPKQAHALLATTVSYMDAVREHHGEIPGIQALLVHAGLPLEPPADWIDKNQQYRLADDRRIAKHAQAQAESAQTSQSGACHASKPPSPSKP
ncbi:MAG: hypothetical protein L0H70_05905 [Xanthomonadales bacterium]|nr:hypothetical protein [Xanthomonadales bacterium]